MTTMATTTATAASTIPSSPPVPSITLQVTAEEASSFLAASRSLLAEVKASASANNHSPPLALHERLYRAAKSCTDPTVRFFVERLEASTIPLTEVQAALVLLHDSDRTTKMEHLCRVFDASSSTTDAADGPSVNRSQLQALLRAVLVGLTCSLSAPSTPVVVVEGQPAAPASTTGSPPTKKTKQPHPSNNNGSDQATLVTATTKAEADLFRTTCQSPSFDSSLATAHGDDEWLGSVRREVEDVADYAATRAFAQTAADAKLGWKQVHTWALSSPLVPWLALLDHEQWQSLIGPEQSASTTTLAKSNGASTAQATKENQSNHSSTGPSNPSMTPFSVLKDKSLVRKKPTSRNLVSFDFKGSDHPEPLCINLSESNVKGLRHLARQTGWIDLPSGELCRRLSQLAKERQQSKGPLVLRRQDLTDSPETVDRILFHRTPSDRQYCMDALLNIFDLFRRPDHDVVVVDLQEFSTGLSLLCEGSKSSKLSVGFELMDSSQKGTLSEDQLLRYIYSYLLMLTAISLLPAVGSTAPSTEGQRESMQNAVRHGAQWTIGHYLKHEHGDEKKHDPNDSSDQYSFHSFASWYSTGGYTVAPWLELLDLGKFLKLIPTPAPVITTAALEGSQWLASTDPRATRLSRDRQSTLRRHHQSRSQKAKRRPEVLFVFPLAGARSLILLKEDALYVREVVEQLGLLASNPDALWSDLSTAVDAAKPRPKGNLSIFVDMDTFVRCMMQQVCAKLPRKDNVNHAAVEEVLCNFFECFDLEQRDQVPLEELMGGLTLLCGGKKSAKLAFAFEIFDSRSEVRRAKKGSIPHSLSGQDLYLFVRSILIVTFSCCRQSLDMNEAEVTQCIGETCNMICNDVMQSQWALHKSRRLNFDQFGQWYNDGGYERAPWLELLDLKKWVTDKNSSDPKSVSNTRKRPPPISEPIIPPPPPEDALDPTFFDDHGIMNMDSMDDMDMIFMQPSMDKEDPKSPGLRLTKSYSFGSPGGRTEGSGTALSIQLCTNDAHGGYSLSISNNRILDLRFILERNQVHKLDARRLCPDIQAKPNRATFISRNQTVAVIQDILGLQPSAMQSASDPAYRLRHLLLDIFDSFDEQQKNKANAMELACGLAVFCRGKKSEKLDFAFDFLDKKHRSYLNQEELTAYMRSFLTVILSVVCAKSLKNDSVDDVIATISGTPCERSLTTLRKVANDCASWAASKAFEDVCSTSKKKTMCFDDFAQWYTASGFHHIPWLELLDLQKWVFKSN